MYERMPWQSRLLPEGEWMAAELRERDCEHSLEVLEDRIACRRCPAEWRKLEK